MSRFDVMKSLLRSAARAATDQLRRLDLPEPMRRALADLLSRSLTLRDGQLTAAMGRLPALSAVGICVKPGSIQIDASLNDGSPLQVCLVPQGITFAPGGAKDVSFRVQPPEAAAERAVCDVVGAIASEVARAVWGPLLLASGPDADWAFVERDGDVLRVDLRTVPAVRKALARAPMAAVMEALTVSAMVAEPSQLRLTLALPEMARR
jgi:hypothetical protein